jgi:hypothetical protein
LTSDRTDRLGTEAQTLLGTLTDSKARWLIFASFLDRDRRIGVFLVRRPGLTAAAGADSDGRKNRDRRGQTT